MTISRRAVIAASGVAFYRSVAPAQLQLVAGALDAEKRT